MNNVCLQKAETRLLRLIEINRIKTNSVMQGCKVGPTFYGRIRPLWALVATVVRIGV